MSITDELRDWAGQHKGWHLFDMQLKAIADGIDAEHEREVRQAHADGLNEQVDFHDNFIPSNYVLLPVDADGEPIHQGELVEYRDHSGAWHEETTVAAITDVGYYVWAGAHLVHVWGNDCRHHHAPTVEDLLRQFLGECESAANLGYDEVPQEVFDDYAAKLRLAEGEDE